LAAGWNNNGLNQIWCGGEAFPIDLANQLVQTPQMESMAQQKLPFGQHDIHRRTMILVVPIGKPIGNTNIFIRDSFGNLLPKGIAELLLAAMV
jgi:hypothetical protein